MIIGIILIALAVLGGLRIVNQEPLTRELRTLKEDSLLLQNILTDLNYSNNLDSSNSYDHWIAKFYSSHNMGYPDLAPVDGYVTRGLQKKNNHLVKNPSQP